ncbi:MAG: DNA-processing protein DprA [Nitrospiria bacterium]
MEIYRYWLALQHVAGVGNVLFKRLIEVYKAPEAVFEASDESLSGIEGLSKNTAQAIHTFNAFDAVDRELEQIRQHQVSIITLNDPAYPERLADIYDPPPFLYMKGSLENTDDAPRSKDPQYPIAVVGARKTTPYGRQVTERLCRGLAEQGATIVSGFARGIDALAHQSALAAGGKTIAVLGCGIDVVYPPEHKKLYQHISEQGAILSEFPMGTPPVSRNFPKRNRIISGLSLGCLVVEAGLKSGSLITARLAMEQGREVFAVPGPIYSGMSAGPHQLIASGAKLVQNASDILGEILPQQPSRAAGVGMPKAPPLAAEETDLFESLSFEPKHIDVLILESQKPAAAVSGLLLTLELKGLARQMAGQYYVRV